MEAFRDDGHLTTQLLNALTLDADALTDLERLEAAEHLAYCALCLQRYTDVLTDIPLAEPARSCQRRLGLRLRARSLRRVTGRCAAAAVAVTLSLTLLWGSGPAFTAVSGSPHLSRRLSGLTAALNETLSTAVTGWSDQLDAFRPGQLTQGGTP